MPARPPSPKDSFAAHCAELLASLGPVRVRRMFGGHGFYVDDVFIALAIGEQLYLKADSQTHAQFDAVGSRPFVFEANGRPVTISYRTTPDDAMESPHLMRPWARLAMDAALRARAAKPASRAKKKSLSPALAETTPAETGPVTAPRPTRAATAKPPKR